ncbi:MAG: monovalent cation/H(+) antiporter subunit G [Chloroflexi bacterium]|nr:monovalent cation/H(+) antiporter subunit G [Chloroflexota bacterium]
MLSLLAEVIGSFLLVVGTAFCVLGVYGMLRLPDTYNRLHAVQVIPTLGVGSVLLSLLFLAEPRAGVKGLATAAFLLLTGPAVTHLVARAAYRLGVPLAHQAVRDDLARDRKAA